MLFYPYKSKKGDGYENILKNMTELELRKHNRKAVDDMKKKVKEGFRKLIYVAGTGCGKTWAFMGFANEFSSIVPELAAPHILKILYIMPKNVIRDNVEGYEEFHELGLHVDFATYNYFSKEEKGVERFKHYDLIVIDECHHLGGDLYGKNILSAMNRSEKFFLGLTATPYRSCDKINVEDFFEAAIHGISVWDAIHMGLMPPFNYHICLPEKDTKQIEKEYDHQYRAVVDLNDSADAVYDIVNSYKRDKWICFFPDTKSLERAKKEIKEIFEGYKVFTLLSSLKNLKEVMDGVRKSKKAVVLSVDILLEGVHLEGITGIVLYRNVTSTIAFQQMIGRTCRIGNQIEPVIIDTSQSARKILAALIRESKKGQVPSFVSNEGYTKEILKVGIGSTMEYDLNKVLQLMDPSYQKHEDMKRAARKANEKYHSFGGKDYETYEELMNSGLNYKKFKSCAELMKLSAKTAFELLKEESHEE